MMDGPTLAHIPMIQGLGLLGGTKTVGEAADEPHQGLSESGAALAARSEGQGAMDRSPGEWAPTEAPPADPAKTTKGTERTAVPTFELLKRLSAKPVLAQPQDSWGLLIAGYLYLGGLGAGAFIMATLGDWLGLGLAPTFLGPIGGWAWDWSKALVLWGPSATAFGAALLVFHLGRNWFLAWTACFNIRTSWMARGFIILATFIVVGCLVAMVAVFGPFWPERLLVLWRIAQAIGVAFAFGTAIYTGILLQSIKFIPAWNSPFLPFLFLASALSTGAMGVIMGAMGYRFIVTEPASAHELARSLEYIEPGLIVIEAALLTLYVRHLRRGKPEGLLSSRMWLSGSWRYGFWGGIVGLALALPFALDVVNLGVRSDVLAIVTAASVLFGGFLLRCGILGIAVKETPPLYKLSMWRALRPAIAATTQRSPEPASHSAPTVSDQSLMVS
jgi:polysulfide reductase chain C